MNKKEQLQSEYNTLLEVITDLEWRLFDEEQRFTLFGKRSKPASDWRVWSNASLMQYKADLLIVNKELKKFEKPEELLKELMKGVSLLTLLRLWWKV